MSLLSEKVAFRGAGGAVSGLARNIAKKVSAPVKKYYGYDPKTVEWREHAAPKMRALYENMDAASQANDERAFYRGVAQEERLRKAIGAIDKKRSNVKRDLALAGTAAGVTGLTLGGVALKKHLDKKKKEKEDQKVACAIDRIFEKTADLVEDIQEAAQASPYLKQAQKRANKGALIGAGAGALVGIPAIYGGFRVNDKPSKSIPRAFGRGMVSGALIGTGASAPLLGASIGALKGAKVKEHGDAILSYLRENKGYDEEQIRNAKKILRIK